MTTIIARLRRAMGDRSVPPAGAVVDVARQAAQIVSVSNFFVGAFSLLLLVPLGQFGGGAETGWATVLGALLVQSNENAYALSQLALVFGSLSLWVFGLRVGLIPSALSEVALPIWLFIKGFDALANGEAA